MKSHQQAHGADQEPHPGGEYVQLAAMLVEAAVDFVQPAGTLGAGRGEFVEPTGHLRR